MELSEAAGAGSAFDGAVLIAGPTASGKSALALELAERHDGVVINTDSMQVYATLRILTARPSEAEMKRVPHLLYGHVDPLDDYSTGRWLAEVAALRRHPAIVGRMPIFVGGTGLYFRALTEGLSEMPTIPEAVRRRWRLALREQGAQALHALLATRDPEAAAAIRPADSQRILRALEVLEASGRSIRAWQRGKGTGLVPKDRARLIVLSPERETLVARIEARVDRMVAEGVLGEVEALASRGPDPALPATKAIGYREFSATLDGTLSLGEAVVRTKAATRRYAKRQATWFRTQLGPEWQRVAGPHELR